MLRGASRAELCALQDRYHDDESSCARDRPSARRRRRLETRTLSSAVRRCHERPERTRAPASPRESESRGLSTRSAQWRHERSPRLVYVMWNLAPRNQIDIEIIESSAVQPERGRRSPRRLTGDRSLDGVPDSTESLRIAPSRTGEAPRRHPAVTAMLDRLPDHAYVLTCGPRSWRTRLQGRPEPVVSPAMASSLGLTQRGFGPRSGDLSRGNYLSIPQRGADPSNPRRRPPHVRMDVLALSGKDEVEDSRLGPSPTGRF
jgi:hypothetical protein